MPGSGWTTFGVVWSDPIARRAIVFTLFIAFSTVAFELILGLLLAVAMVNPFRGRRSLMTLFVVPLFMSPVIISNCFSLILVPQR